MNRLQYPEDREQILGIFRDREFEEDKEVNARVSQIIEGVRQQGDRALFEYTQQFDGVSLDSLQVDQEEIDQAYQRIEQSFIASLNRAIENISDFHRKQLTQSWFDYNDGGMVGQKITPLQRVGAYIPGGRAAYPSSVLMTVVPAGVAGVEQVVAVTPPDQEGTVNPYTLVALAETGVQEIYKVGGAQAIAALAWGTDTISPVDKIVGPGNIYVTMAKKMAYGRVDIDMLAGPSEVLVLADETAKARLIAADLLSQAEHDPRSVAVLITTSGKIAEQTREQLEAQLERLSRVEIARESLENRGLIITVDTLKQGIELVNRFAPEHFELMVDEPFACLGDIRNAGAIFIGENSPEPLGDYMAGPNHVLPTGGTARFASPLTTDDYLKKSSLIYYQPQGLDRVGEVVAGLAELEELDGHAAAIRARLEKKGEEQE